MILFLILVGKYVFGEGTWEGERVAMTTRLKWRGKRANMAGSFQLAGFQ